MRARLVGLLVISALLCVMGSGEPKGERAVITGKVVDAETGRPLEDVAVYLRNTACGASTAKDGTFTLENVVSGEYEMVLTRVGFVRETIHVKVEGSKVQRFEVSLRAEEVPVRGTDVIAHRASDSRSNLGSLFPKAADETISLYGAENSLPIGVLLTEGALYMVALEPAIVDSERFLRLWFLAFNTSESPLDFDATRALTLDIQKPSAAYHDLPPQDPDPSSPEIQDTTTLRLVSQAIGTTLAVIGYQRTTFVSNNDRFDLMAGSKPWLGVNAPGEVLGGINPRRLWEIYDRSTRVDILTHYRIFPRSGVHGYVYFPFPGLDWQGSSAWLRGALIYRYVLTIRTLSGTKQIDFAGH